MKLLTIIICVAIQLFSITQGNADAVEQRKEAGAAQLAICMKNNSGFIELNDPNQLFSLAGVQNIHIVAPLTGDYSENKTKERYGVGGTDLGIMMNVGDTTYFAFGDTFYNENRTVNWINNSMAFSTDSDYTDGITLDGMILNKSGVARELVAGKKTDNIEMAKIPTGAIAIGDTMYISYMSVRHWGPRGSWDCNYGAVIKSKDYGKTWSHVKGLSWKEDSNFCQMCPVLGNDGNIYVIGIGAGRLGSAKLMRVAPENYEDKSDYEYLIGIEEDGSPIFQAGEQGLANAYSILPRGVGEMSVMYSQYLQEWIMTYNCGTGVYMRVAKELWGPYSKAIKIISENDYPEPYGAFLNPRYVSEDGRKVMFIMSMYDPYYNSLVMEMELVAK